MKCTAIVGVAALTLAGALAVQAQDTITFDWSPTSGDSGFSGFLTFTPTSGYYGSLPTVVSPLILPVDRLVDFQITTPDGSFSFSDSGWESDLGIWNSSGVQNLSLDFPADNILVSATGITSGDPHSSDGIWVVQTQSQNYVPDAANSAGLLALGIGGLFFCRRILRARA